MREAYAFEKVRGNVKFICRICGGSNEDLINKMRESNNYRAVNCMSNEEYSYVHDGKRESGGCTFLIFNKKTAIELMESSAWIKLVKEYASLYPMSRLHIIELYRARIDNNEVEATELIEKLQNLIRKKYPNYMHMQIDISMSCN